MPVRKLKQKNTVEVPSPGIGGGGGIADLGDLGLPEIISGLGELTAGPALARLEAEKLKYSERMSDLDHRRAIEKIQEAARAGGAQDRETLRTQAKLNTPEGQKLARAEALGITDDDPKVRIAKLLDYIQEATVQEGERARANLQNPNTPEGRRALMASMESVTAAQTAGNLARMMTKFVTTYQQAEKPITEIFQAYRKTVNDAVAAEANRNEALHAVLRQSSAQSARALRNLTPEQYRSIVGPEQAVTGTLTPKADAVFMGAPSSNEQVKMLGKGGKIEDVPEAHKWAQPTRGKTTATEEATVRVKNWGPGNFSSDLIGRVVDSYQLTPGVAEDLKTYLTSIHTGKGGPSQDQVTTAAKQVQVWGPRRLDSIRHALAGLAITASSVVDGEVDIPGLMQQAGADSADVEAIKQEFKDLSKEASDFASLTLNLVAPALDVLATVPSANATTRHQLEKTARLLNSAKELPPEDVAKATMARSLQELFLEANSQAQMAMAGMGSQDFLNQFRTSMIEMTADYPDIQQAVSDSFEVTDGAVKVFKFQQAMDSLGKIEGGAVQSAFGAAKDRMEKVDTALEATGFESLEDLSATIVKLQESTSLTPPQQAQLKELRASFEEIQNRTAQFPVFDDEGTVAGAAPAPTGGSAPAQTPTTQPSTTTKPAGGYGKFSDKRAPVKYGKAEGGGLEALKKEPTLAKPEAPTTQPSGGKAEGGSAYAEPTDYPAYGYDQLAIKHLSGKSAAYRAALEARPGRPEEYAAALHQFSLDGAAQARARNAKAILDRQSSSLPQNIPPGGSPVAAAPEAASKATQPAGAPLAGGSLAAKNSLEAMPLPSVQQPSANVMAVSQQTGGLPSQVSRTPTADRLRGTA